ncbi:hypothetical protein CAEBREN_31642 [Caenorhabditis brenneri]|uniref:Uncharacterized protein n=1 Tax=Caenorhabditis brenneri TaxID=135651 RepID=G0PDD0_CAEBE|nr:hypothetical protein CAEBREN_31642 [Caenorhabditis brenneri]
MSFAKSFYADEKKAEQPQQPQDFAVSPAIPATTPIAEEALTPAQIQDAIRLYRSVLNGSASAPSSPARRPAPAVPERPQVHSNYYGGGPTDIPLSYLLNYNTSPARVAPASAPVTQAPEQHFSEQQLIEQLQSLQVQQQQVAPEPVYQSPTVQQNVAPKKAPVLQKMYDDEESGYCFARNTKEEEEEEQQVAQEGPETHVATPTSVPQMNYSAPENYSPAPVPNNYSKNVSGPSEYIGMSNDCKFIYDTQKAPNSYFQNNSYTLVNATPVAPILTQEVEEHGTTTFDTTQVPESPAVTSRFRGLIRNAQTPVQATAPIVVERVSDPVNKTVHPNYNNYSAFMPVNQISMESEYQLPVLNDLASCIEHY